MAVGKPAFIQNLQEDVKDVGVSLFYLVEKHERVGAPAHGLGELAASLVPDVSRRGTDEAGNRVLLAVLGHIDAHHGRFIVEEEVCQCLRQLGLAHTGGAEEEEGTSRAVGVGHARTGAAHCVRYGSDGFLLADHAVAQHGFHVEQLLGLALQHLAGRDAGPGGNDLRDGVRAYLLIEHRIALFGGLDLRGREILFQRWNLAVVDLRGQCEVAVALGDFGLAAQVIEFFLDVLDIVDGLLLVGPAGLELAELLALVRELPLQGG